MSPLTLFLAKLIGLFFLIVSVALALRKDEIVETSKEMLRDRGLLLIIGSGRVAVGLALALSHSIWTGGALPIVVTLIGWLTLLRGLVVLFTPGERLTALFAATRFEQNYYAYVAIGFALGLYLTIAGFLY